jgi:hypothetical protein
MGYAAFLLAHLPCQPPSSPHGEAAQLWRNHSQGPVMGFAPLGTHGTPKKRCIAYISDTSFYCVSLNMNQRLPLFSGRQAKDSVEIRSA